MAPRRFAAPNLRLTPAALGAAIDGSERSAYEPRVVTGLPAGGVPLRRGHRQGHRRPWQLG